MGRRVAVQSALVRHTNAQMLNTASRKAARRHTVACLGTKSGGRDDECKRVQNKLADRVMRRRIAEKKENLKAAVQTRDTPKERTAIVTIKSNCQSDWLSHRSSSSPHSTVVRQRPAAFGSPGALSCSNPYRHPCCMPVRWNEVACPPQHWMPRSK
jgi:hypothetical protein